MIYFLNCCYAHIYLLCCSLFELFELMITPREPYAIDKLVQCGKRFVTVLIIWDERGDHAERLSRAYLRFA